MRLRARAALTAAALIIAVSAHAQTTPAQTEGPYYKSGSPRRDTLFEEADPGRRVTVTGRVLDASGKAVSGAWIDVWQADATGSYDNRGFRYRGHTFADAQGRYTFRTVIPGEYPGRTPHIHVKVRAGNGPILTTQLYFPEAEAGNRRDGIYDERLLVRWDADGRTARFDFVLP